MGRLSEQVGERYAIDAHLHSHPGKAYAGLNERVKARQAFASALALAKADASSPLSPEQRRQVIEAVVAWQSKLN